MSPATLTTMTQQSTQNVHSRNGTVAHTVPYDATMPYGPHQDAYSEPIGLLLQTILNWRITTIIGFAIFGLVVLLQGIGLIALAHRPPLVQTLVVDKSGRTTAIASLKPLYADANAQKALAHYFVPLVVQSAFAVTAPQEDVRNLKEFVRPFLLPGSQAAQFFVDYFTHHNPATLSSRESITVTVDPIGDPRGNTYFVGWTATASDGYHTSAKHYTADVQVVFRDPTASNIAGLFIQGFTLDTETNTNE